MTSSGGKSINNHKTIILIDHDQSMFEPACSIDLSELFKSKNASTSTNKKKPQLDSISKSIWSCTCEAVLEFSRICWDLFLNHEKLLSVGVTRFGEFTNLCSFESASQNQTCLASGLARCQIPPSKQNRQFSTTTAHRAQSLVNCFNMFSQLSDLQLKYCTNGIDSISNASTSDVLTKRRFMNFTEESGGIGNKGRVLYVTQADGDEIDKLVKEFTDFLTEHNSDVSALLETATSSSLNLNEDNNTIRKCAKFVTFVDHIHIDFIVCRNTDSDETRKSSIPTSSVQNFSYKVHFVDLGGQHLANENAITPVMLNVAKEHYNLSSTTVTGIPMKEEQNASSSANYDVQLLHISAIHGGGSGVCETTPFCPKDVVLKWCSPRSSNTGAGKTPPQPSEQLMNQHIMMSAPITPADVSSRPSSCLTNFLLSGRSVMLESKAEESKKGSNNIKTSSSVKAFTHMLTSQNGRIYIHSLSLRPNMFNSSVSATTSVATNIRDYRVEQFMKAMNVNRLLPRILPNENSAADIALNRVLTRKNLVKSFTLFPLVNNTPSAAIFNVACLQPLIRVVSERKACLSVPSDDPRADHDEEISAPRQALFTLISMESKLEPVLGISGSTIPFPTSMKSNREEQYKFLFAQLEQFLVAHLNFESIEDNPKEDESSTASSTSKLVRKILQCLCDCRNKSLASVIKAHSDSECIQQQQQSQTSKSNSQFSENSFCRSSVTRKRKILRLSDSNNECMIMPSIFDLCMNSVKAHLAKRQTKPFGSSRTDVGEKAKLYLNLATKRAQSAVGAGESISNSNNVSPVVKS